MFWVLKPQVKRSIVKVEMAAIQQQNSELIEGLRPSFRGADRIAVNLKKWQNGVLIILDIPGPCPISSTNPSQSLSFGTLA